MIVVFFIHLQCIFSIHLSFKIMYRFITVLICSLFVVACKPAAEDRVKMHENAKRVSDSIARTIDIPLNEVMPKPAVVVDSTKK